MANAVSNARRRQIVREQFELVAAEYRDTTERLAFWQSSRGLVSSYDPNRGGRSSTVSDPCANAAIKDAFERFATKKARTWRCLTTRVYGDLLEAGQGSPAKVLHRQLLAWLLFEHVMLGKDFKAISEKEVYGEGHLPISTVYAYYSEVIDISVIYALEMGIIP